MNSLYSFTKRALWAALFVLLVAMAGTANAQDDRLNDELHVKYWNGSADVIDELNLGVRPIGAWTEPFVFYMYTDGPTFNVNVLDFTPSDDSFIVEDVEVPFMVNKNEDIELIMSTNVTYPGVIERQFLALTENRSAHIWPVTAELYQPSTPDVWEYAYDLGTVSSGTNYKVYTTDITTSPLHNDYHLPFPEIPEGYDAVYKLQIPYDMLLDAYVSVGENGKVALYAEDFYGEGGPMYMNHYLGLEHVDCNNSNYYISDGPLIQNLPVPAGTYYLVASSTDGVFEVSISVSNMPCPTEDDCLTSYAPENHSESVDPGSVFFRWNIPQFATRWRLVCGTQLQPDLSHPETIVTDWSTDMQDYYTLTNLLYNRKYYWYVEFTNDICENSAHSPTFDFTTRLYIPTDLNADDPTVFDNELIHLKWTEITDDSLLYYNVYRDGDSIGYTTDTIYSNGPLAYNMDGYTYYVTAVYSLGESAPSNMVSVRVSGKAEVHGLVSDTVTQAPIANATVTLEGQDEFGDDHTYSFTTDSLGFYSGQVYAGSYNGSASCDGFQSVSEPILGNPMSIIYNSNSQYDFALTKLFEITSTANPIEGGSISGSGTYPRYGSCTLIATPYEGYHFLYWTHNDTIVSNRDTYSFTVTKDDHYVATFTTLNLFYGVQAHYDPDRLDNNSPYVKVYWDNTPIVETFETGDFSSFDWNTTGSYPWEITTTHPYDGSYCIRSTNYNVSNSTSSIDVTVDIPANGIMSFFGYISCENSWDNAYFYIDGVQKGNYTGAGNSWGEKKFEITAGTHNFKWTYQKDNVIDSNEDRFYVDYITFYKRHEPAQPGWHTYCESEFSNSVGSNLTTTPSWAYKYPAAFLHTNYAGWQITKVSLFSDNMYRAVGGNYTCRIYVGGNEPAAGTMVSTITVDVPSNQNAWVDWDLTTPVNVTGNDPIWVVWTANTTVSSWPAGCCGDLNDLGTWWDGGNGWEHLTYGTWTMRQYFDNGAGKGFYSGIKDDTVDLNHYRLFRANSDGTEIVLLTDTLTQTQFVDSSWLTLNSGSYIYGVNIPTTDTVWSNVIEMPYRTITATSNPTEGGTFIGCGDINNGDLHTLIAIPNTGYHFVNWMVNESIVSTADTLSFVVTRDSSFVANFELDIHDITATADPLDGGIVTGGGAYQHFDSCTLVCAPFEGYRFLHWTVNGTTVVSTTDTLQFIVTQDSSFVAHFEAIPPVLATQPDTLDLGYRPAGSWMRPYTFTLTNIDTIPMSLTGLELKGTGSDALELDLSDIELPLELGVNDEVTLGITWGDQPASVDCLLRVYYTNENGMDSAKFVVKAEVYDPEEGDVWETAKVVDNFPYSDTLNATTLPLYDNYILPLSDSACSKDAVYKLVFSQDALLNASVISGDNGLVSLYREGFEGVGGPDVDNIYLGANHTTGHIELIPKEITVNNGDAMCDRVPFFGYWADYYQKSEFIQPATDLAKINGKAINSLTFYSNASPNFSASFKVFLKEVSDTTLNDFQGPGTIVYEGPITFSHNMMTIPFTTPYIYHGGNLLVGVYETVTGNFENIQWFGISAPGAAVHGYNNGGLDNISPEQQNFLPKMTFSYIPIPGNSIDIENMTVTAGTYYLVANSTSDEFAVSINAETLPCPEQAYEPSPYNRAFDINEDSVSFSWKFGDYTTEYCLRFGTDPESMDTLVPWTRDLDNQYVFSDSLDRNNTYYWQVGERNDGCPEGTYGPVWRFYTTCDIEYPINFFANEEKIFDDEQVTFHWTHTGNNLLQCYNIYRDGYLIGTSGHTSYTDGPLAYNMGGYLYYVTAQYVAGESAPSNTVFVKVSGYGDLAGYVYESDSITGIADATVTLVGQDEFGDSHNYTLTTDSLGFYSGQVYAGSYNGSATAEYHLSNDAPVQGNPIVIQYNQTTSSVDFVLEFVSHDIAATALPQEGGIVAGAGTYHHNDTCSLVATSINGYHFVNWTQNDVSVSFSDTLEFIVTQDSSFVANFSLNGYVIAATANPTTGGLISGAGNYLHFDTCTLSISPNTGYHFLNWTANDTLVTTDTCFSFIVTGPADYVANFELDSFDIVAEPNPEGGGTTTGTGTYDYGETATLTATPFYGYNFIAWTKDGVEVSNQASYSFTVTEDGVYLAHFGYTNYLVTATADPVEGGSVTGAGNFDYTQPCTLVATPAEGYLFLNWTEDTVVVATTPEYAFIVEGNRDLVANFGTVPPAVYQVTVTADPAEGGNVTGGGQYQGGMTVTVAATSLQGYAFVNWTEDTVVVSTEAEYTFNVYADRNLVAHFEPYIPPTMYSIEAVADPIVGGSIDGTGLYEEGDSVVLVATAMEHYLFLNWTEDGAVVDTVAVLGFVANADRSLVAHFGYVPPMRTVTVLPTENGTLSAPATATMGDLVQVVAEPDPDYLLASLYYYTDDPSVTTPINLVTRSFVMPDADVTVGGVFVMADNDLDVNEDGFVDILDVMAIIHFLAGHDPDPFNLGRADVDKDGVIDIADALLLNAIIHEMRDGEAGHELGGSLSLEALRSGCDENTAYYDIVDGQLVLASPVALSGYEFHLGAQPAVIGLPGFTAVGSWNNGEYVLCLFNLSGEQEAGTYALLDLNGAEVYGIVAATQLGCKVRVETGITAVSEVTEADYTVFPVPARDQVRVAGPDITAVEVFNVLGQRLVSHDNVRADLVELNLGALAPGCYLLRIRSEHGTFVRNITVVR